MECHMYKVIQGSIICNSKNWYSTRRGWLTNYVFMQQSTMQLKKMNEEDLYLLIQNGLQDILLSEEVRYTCIQYAILHIRSGRSKKLSNLLSNLLMEKLTPRVKRRVQGGSGWGRGCSELSQCILLILFCFLNHTSALSIQNNNKKYLLLICV